MSFIVSNTYDIHATASLDLQFANKKSLVDQISGRNLIDHTRQSSATYVGSDGLIKTAVTNLVLQSEDFLTTWTLGGNTTVTPNYGTAPNGTATADRVEMPNDIGTVVTQSVTTVSGLTYVFSVYARATSGSSQLTLVLGTANEQISLTEDWQRYSVSFTATGTLTDAQLDNGSNAIDILAWGAQLEESSTVGEYVKTTSTKNSAPRFDHDPETGESLGLLVEESRTNLITNSDLLGDFAIGTGGSSSIVTSTAPDSTTQVYQLLADSAFPRCRCKFATSSSNNITVSAFLKKNTHRYVQIGFGGSSNNFCALFDLEPGVTNRLLSQDGDGTFTNIDAGYQELPNGWIRAWAVGTTIGTDGMGIGIVEDDTKTTFNDENVFDGTESIYIWGAQYEDNKSFPTSYIPTTTAAVTRAADVASISGTNFSSWYRQDEGTFFADIVGFPISSGQFPRIFEASDGTNNNVIRSQKYGSNTVRNNVVAGGTVTMAQDGGTIAAGISGKTAFGVAENNCAIVTNGGTPSVDTTVTMPSNLNQLGILVAIGGVSEANSSISRFTYWPTRLPNDTLKTITT